METKMGVAVARLPRSDVERQTPSIGKREQALILEVLF